MQYNLSIRELTELTEKFYYMGRYGKPYEFNSSDLPQPKSSPECAMNDVVMSNCNHNYKKVKNAIYPYRCVKCGDKRKFITTD